MGRRASFEAGGHSQAVKDRCTISCGKECAGEFCFRFLPARYFTSWIYRHPYTERECSARLLLCDQTKLCASGHRFTICYRSLQGPHVAPGGCLVTEGGLERGSAACRCARWHWPFQCWSGFCCDGMLSGSHALPAGFCFARAVTQEAQQEKPRGRTTCPLEKRLVVSGEHQETPICQRVL